MSLRGVIKKGLYRQYMAWVFIKDWFSSFVLIFPTVLLGTVFVFGCLGFIEMGGNNWEYFVSNFWWYFRLCIVIGVVCGFLLSFYFFPDSYDQELRDLGIRK